MIYVLAVVFIAAYLLFLRSFLWYRHRNRRSRLSRFLSRTACERRRWVIDLTR
jgi:hypothetical protein